MDRSCALCFGANAAVCQMLKQTEKCQIVYIYEFKLWLMRTRLRITSRNILMKDENFTLEYCAVINYALQHLL